MRPARGRRKPFVARCIIKEARSDLSGLFILWWPCQRGLLNFRERRNIWARGSSRFGGDFRGSLALEAPSAGATRAKPAFATPLAISAHGDGPEVSCFLAPIMPF
jgi:hypothetical protein